MKTKDEILGKHPVMCDNQGKAVYVSFSSAMAAMEEYAKQQSIAFIKHNCPDIKLDDSLLNAGYAGFLMKQNESK